MSEEEGPYACLFHENVKALRVFLVKDNQSDLMVKYGLCFTCARRLGFDKGFAEEINKKLCERINRNKAQKKKWGKECILKI